MNIESTKIYFDNLAENWDNICHHDMKKIDTIVSLAQLPENSRILDIATGTGVLIPACWIQIPWKSSPLISQIRCLQWPEKNIPTHESISRLRISIALRRAALILRWPTALIRTLRISPFSATSFQPA